MVCFVVTQHSESELSLCLRYSKTSCRQATTKKVTRKSQKSQKCSILLIWLNENGGKSIVQRLTKVLSKEIIHRHFTIHQSAVHILLHTISRDESMQQGFLRLGCHRE